MACNCIELIDASLAERNSKLDVGFTFGHEGRPGYTFPALSTSKINTRNRDRAGAIPTFCPFCGMKYRADPAHRASEDVLAERRRQITAEGWTPEHDDSHQCGEIASAAAAYAICSTLSAKRRSIVSGIFSFENNQTLRDIWPWHRDWWKPKDRRRDLVRAGALIIAEIERLDRAAERETREQAEAKANG